MPCARKRSHVTHEQSRREAHQVSPVPGCDLGFREMFLYQGRPFVYGKQTATDEAAADTRCRAPPWRRSGPNEEHQSAKAWARSSRDASRGDSHGAKTHTHKGRAIPYSFIYESHELQKSLNRKSTQNLGSGHGPMEGCNTCRHTMESKSQSPHKTRIPRLFPSYPMVQIHRFQSLRTKIPHTRGVLTLLY